MTIEDQVEGEFINWPLAEYVNPPDPCVIISCLKSSEGKDIRRVFFLCRSREEFTHADFMITFENNFDLSTRVVRGRVPESWAPVTDLESV